MPTGEYAPSAIGPPSTRLSSLHSCPCSLSLLPLPFSNLPKLFIGFLGRHDACGVLAAGQVQPRRGAPCAEGVRRTSLRRNVRVVLHELGARILIYLYPSARTYEEHMDETFSVSSVVLARPSPHAQEQQDIWFVSLILRPSDSQLNSIQLRVRPIFLEDERASALPWPAVNGEVTHHGTSTRVLIQSLDVLHDSAARDAAMPNIHVIIDGCLGQS